MLLQRMGKSSKARKVKASAKAFKAKLNGKARAQLYGVRARVQVSLTSKEDVHVKEVEARTLTGHSHRLAGGVRATTTSSAGFFSLGQLAFNRGLVFMGLV